MRLARSALQERYAYYFAVPALVVAFFARARRVVPLARIVLALVALAFLVNAGVGIYHSGIEWKWWAGPASCSGGVAVEWGEGGVARRSSERRWSAATRRPGAWLASPSPDGTR